MVEGGTPNTLQRNGITRPIKVGTIIVVSGYKAKDGACAPTATTRSRRPHDVHGLVAPALRATARIERKPKPKGQ
jgi:hypothetical protein